MRATPFEDLAEVAGMSRTRFADHFRTLVGLTPIEYLAVWCITIARQLLGKGKPVKSVDAQVGYDSAAAFSRVFSRTGKPPRESARSGIDLANR
ncbi:MULTISPECIES: helix-turn-helix domain-containing protein [unclassified Mesorhizobium]|uniref:helix-turn-helix domain-containing protein n=1 Tax=unclassified Mesorhizobium TaxID=325217 RepID=UPI003339041D